MHGMFILSLTFLTLSVSLFVSFTKYRNKIGNFLLSTTLSYVIFLEYCYLCIRGEALMIITASIYYENKIHTRAWILFVQLQRRFLLHFSYKRYSFFHWNMTHTERVIWSIDLLLLSKCFLYWALSLGI